MHREIATQAQDLPHRFEPSWEHVVGDQGCAQTCNVCGKTERATPLHTSDLADQVRESANYTTVTTQ